LEFLPEAEGIFPASSEDLALITTAYNRVRYGEYPEDREEVDAVESAWRRVNEQAKLLSTGKPSKERTSGSGRLGN
jgi:hypothetical protein